MGEGDEAFEQIASALELAQETDHQQALPDILVEYARVTLAPSGHRGSLWSLESGSSYRPKGWHVS